jgi:hypothetical protein
MLTQRNKFTSHHRPIRNIEVVNILALEYVEVLKNIITDCKFYARSHLSALENVEVLKNSII